MNVRPCATAEEMRAAFAPIWHYFGQNPPSEDAIRHFKRVLPAERVHAGFDGDRVVSGSASFAFDLTVPGGQVKAAGVTIVGVLPTHRRRGFMGAMMRSQLDAARARGEAVAVLWATEDTLYSRYGLRHGIDGGRDRPAARPRRPFCASRYTWRDSARGSRRS